jgi:hypothetical protein
MTSLAIANTTLRTPLALAGEAIDGQRPKSARSDTGPQPSTGPAALVVLSAAAKQASALKPFSEVTADARTALDAQYATSKANGRVLGGDTSKGDVFDLSKLDRRTVFAIASNSEGKFSKDEQLSAGGELSQRAQAFDNSRAPAPPSGFSITDGSIQKLSLSIIEYYTIEASPEEAASDRAKQEVFAATYNLGLAQGAQDADDSGELDEVSPLIKILRDLAAVFAKQTGPNAVSADKLAEAKKGLKALFAQVFDALPSAPGTAPAKPIGVDIKV